MGFELSAKSDVHLLHVSEQFIGDQSRTSAGERSDSGIPGLRSWLSFYRWPEMLCARGVGVPPTVAQLLTLVILLQGACEH